MALNITQRRIQDVALLDLNGGITRGEDADQLLRSIVELVGAGEKKIVINLINATYIDSAGVGALVAAYSRARRSGANIKLAGLPKNIMQIFRLVDWARLFDVDEDVDDAVGGDWPGPKAI